MSSVLHRMGRALTASALASLLIGLSRVFRRPPQPKVTGQASWPPLTDDDTGTDTDTDTAAVWVAPAADGTCPTSHPVKAKDSSMIHHVPGGLSYDRTVADRCYVDGAAAEADGYRGAKR